MDHVETLADERREVELVGEPRREPEHGDDGRVLGRAHRDEAAHREPDEQRPLATGRVDRGAHVLDAHVETVPRLDPVAQLGEAQRRERRRQPADEPLDGRTPRPRDVAALAAVRADDREAGGRPVEARLRPRRERDRLGQGAVGRLRRVAARRGSCGGRAQLNVPPARLVPECPGSPSSGSTETSTAANGPVPGTSTSSSASPPLGATRPTDSIVSLPSGSTQTS